MVKLPLKRKRKHPIPDISAKISNVYEKLQMNSSIVILPRTKGRRNLNKGGSCNRSSYVGVTKNVDHWQALINMGKSKKYIGSFLTEKEAALTYDFYALGVHGLKAKTNFKHSGVEILAMIESFYTNRNKFVPSLFTTLL
mmetsp:Transcript_13053/g.14680  ORF Transcript_13053/g.14680 Transcript_13053/m.14680 type:complete len:140 (+) Transcript_13053:264-683(+)